MKFAHDKTGRHLRRYELITQRCPSILVWHAKPHALVIRNLPSLNIATFSTLEFLHDLPGHASVILPFRGRWALQKKEFNCSVDLWRELELEGTARNLCWVSDN